MDLFLFNSLGREKQKFVPIDAKKVGLYTCGPTVYDFQHIGNFRSFLFEDLLKRTLLYNNFDVIHIMNITDVGHLVSDSDEGEDKMELGSARSGKTVWEIAEYYTKVFIEDAATLNILSPARYTKATDYIKEQIELVKCLEEKDYTYATSDGIYFDTSKLNDYGKLAQLDVKGMEKGRRIEFSNEKRNKTDFALWKFSPKNTQRQMEWESSWGKGFPGWHLECSAMSRKYLGDTFDIHCGGIDHIPIHHTNEIAQSEACTGKKFVNYWLHGAFLEEETGKMSKSKGEFLRVQTLVDKGYSPLDYRYLCLGTHYRKRLLFSWEILDQAKSARTRLVNRIKELLPVKPSSVKTNSPELIGRYKQNFQSRINDDLNMPEALAVLWEVLKDDSLDTKSKLDVLLDFDKVFGLSLDKTVEQTKEIIPAEVMKLVEQRTSAKKTKNFKLADELRNKIKELGYEIIDNKGGTELTTRK